MSSVLNLGIAAAAALGAWALNAGMPVASCRWSASSPMLLVTAIAAAAPLVDPA